MLGDSSANYNRAYSNANGVPDTCNAGCAQTTWALFSGAYAPAYAGNACLMSAVQRCQGGGVGREGFTAMTGTRAGAGETDCPYKSADEYTNHLITRNDAYRGVTVGCTQGSLPGCGIQDSTVTDVYFPAVFGSSGLGFSTLLPQFETRLSDPDTLTSKDRTQIGYNWTYAKTGHQNQNRLRVRGDCS